MGSDRGSGVIGLGVVAAARTVAGGGGGGTAAVWSAASTVGNSGATMALSEGDSRATSSGPSSSVTLLGSTGKAAGKYHFELEVTAAPGTLYNWYGGVSTSPVLHDQFSMGTGEHAYLRAGGQMWTEAVQGSATATVAEAVVSSVIGVSVDFTAKTAEFRKAGVLFYTYTWSSAPTFYPSLGSTATGVSSRLRGRSADFVHAIPSGYLGWTDA